jgi:hypothetical protein
VYDKYIRFPFLNRAIQFKQPDSREELASLDDARRQDMATAWVQALSGKGDM